MTARAAAIRRAWTGAALLLAIFVADAWLMAAGTTRRADLAVLEWFRQADPRHALAAPGWLLPVLVAVTTLGAGIVRAPLTILAALALWRAGRPRAAALLAGAVASGAVALPLVKTLFHRPRPDLVWHLVVEGDYSFPSGHAMGSAILYGLLGWLLGARIGAVAGAVVAVAVAATRVILGVHWLSDVVAGLALGGAWALAAWALAERGRAGRG